MDKNAEKRVGAKRSGDRIVNVDRLSNLPDPLLCQVLLNIPTKDVVKSSLLSRRWRNIWRYVPGLDLAYGDFSESKAFVSFVDRFMGFNSESHLQKFKLKDRSLDETYRWEWDEPHGDHATRWINTVLKRKVQHLHVLESPWEMDPEVEIPLTVYTCESLVSLKLCHVTLANPKLVFLPCVKIMKLSSVKFANNWAFEMLILGCPLLESLTVERCPDDNVNVLRVCSKSLLSFTHIGHCLEFIEEELVVTVDAPRLENLGLFDTETDRFVIHNLGSLVKVDMNIEFNLSSEKRFDPNDLPKRNMIRNFLIGISSVKEMHITSDTLEAIYNYSRCERVPLLRNLSSLHARFSDYRWEMLPIFLESCRNLKSLSLGFSKILGEQGISILPGPHSFLPTLESVEIVTSIVEEEATEMKLVSYFLENSKILKKFTFCLSDFRKKEESVILKKLLAIPRLSSSCQVFIL